MQFAEAFAWCMLQVTVFTLVVACLHLTATRWRWGGSAALLLAGLYIVGLLTLVCISPWPRWSRLNPGSAHLQENTTGGVATVRHAETPSNQALNEKSPASTARMLERMAPPKSIETIAMNFPAADFGERSRVEAASPRSEHRVSWWIFAVGVAWAAAAIGLSRFLISMAALGRLRSSSVAIDDAPLLNLFEELRREIEENRAIRLCESPSLGVAATCGWRSPMILLPAAWRQWTPDERRAVLAHELAHIREGHFPKWLLSQLAVVAHFYHPIVHWLARRLRFEQEVAADLLAARVFGNRAR
ncbi:MAG TPA: M56 family metallopeptidase, partial [Lacipirellulaceae bacterium]|nr:M56 family metallopeptidase [Lacipirellulaceae bacterium]